MPNTYYEKRKRSVRGDDFRVALPDGGITALQCIGNSPSGVVVSRKPFIYRDTGYDFHRCCRVSDGKRGPRRPGGVVQDRPFLR